MKKKPSIKQMAGRVRKHRRDVAAAVRKQMVSPGYFVARTRWGFVSITPSAKEPGNLQITSFDHAMAPIGDTQRSSLAEAVDYVRWDVEAGAVPRDKRIAIRRRFETGRAVRPKKQGTRVLGGRVVKS